MKDFLLYIFAIVALLFAACTGNEDVEGEQQGAVLDIPIAVCESSTPSLSEAVSRATTGDPGLDENLPAPKFLYVWIVEVEGGRVWQKKFDTDENVWKPMKDEPERWDYTTFKFELPKGVSFNNGTEIQVYAIAAQHELTGTGVDGLSTKTKLDEATLDLASWQNAATSSHTTPAAAHSWALGNLYSTPLALMGSGNSDATLANVKSSLLQNGTYTVRKVGLNISLAENSPTRLYHCAAKADFKWEVASTSQPAVSVQSITLTGLPTQLRVFEPTHNPAGSGSCPLLDASSGVNPLTPGNKWIGREYAYVLQSPTPTHGGDGKLKYNVTFTGDHSSVTDNLTPPAINPVFTTWYRVNANIQ